MQNLFEREELVETTNLYDQDANTIDYSKLEAAIDHASSVADGYLMARLSLPLVNPPEYLLNALKIHVAHIARYLLDSTSEVAKARYEQAIAWLKSGAIGAGTGTDTGTGNTAVISDVAYEVQYEPYWTADRVARLF